MCVYVGGWTSRLKKELQTVVAAYPSPASLRSFKAQEIAGSGPQRVHSFLVLADQPLFPRFVLSLCAPFIREGRGKYDADCPFSSSFPVRGQSRESKGGIKTRKTVPGRAGSLGHVRITWNERVRGKDRRIRHNNCPDVTATCNRHY